MSFFPPVHLVEAISKEVIEIEEKTQEILLCKFQEWIDHKKIVGDHAITPTLAFLGVVDSIMLELAYRNDEKLLNDKLEASWKVFWRGISN